MGIPFMWVWRFFFSFFFSFNYSISIKNFATRLVYFHARNVWKLGGRVQATKLGKV